MIMLETVRNEVEKLLGKDKTGHAMDHIPLFMTNLFLITIFPQQRIKMLKNIEIIKQILQGIISLKNFGSGDKECLQKKEKKKQKSDINGGWIFGKSSLERMK